MFTDWITHVGVEAEGFAVDNEGRPINPKLIKHPLNGHLALDGELSADAGKGLFEAITVPKGTLAEAVASAKSIQRGLGGFLVQRVPFRPGDWSGHGEWNDDGRYKAIIEAVVMEVGYEKAQAIHVMTNVAAVHLNVSGRFNPVHEDGLFVYNVFNNASPFVAAAVHKEIGAGEGHLAIWKDFADQRRFPGWDRWFPTSQSFKNFFEGIPRLCSKVNGELIPLPGTAQRLGNPLDPSFFWHFMRPKVNNKGEWYMELRILPSMENDQIMEFGDPILDMVKLLLSWYHQNGSKPIMNMAEALPAFRYVHQYHPKLFPEQPLGEAAWHQLLQK